MDTILQEEIKTLAHAFDLISDHVVITDPDAKIIYVNNAAVENTGYSTQELIGGNPGKIWGGNMPKEFYVKMWHTIKTEKKPFVGEVRNKKKDGTEYWQELRVFPVLDDNGEIKIFIGIEPNITARKKAEAEREAEYDIIDKLNDYMTGRELKMIQLKKEVEELKSQLKKQK